MSQKEMLVELLKEAVVLDGWSLEVNYEEAAELLLDRVVVLPYKIGTTVYEVKTRTVFDDSIPGNSRAESYVEKVLYDPMISLNLALFYSTKERAEEMADYLNKTESKLKELSEELRKERGY